MVGVRAGHRHRQAGRGRPIGETVDRDGLVAVASPVVLPAGVVAALDGLPSLDFAELVAALRERFPVELSRRRPRPAGSPRRTTYRLLEALTAPLGADRPAEPAPLAAGRATSSGKVILRLSGLRGTAATRHVGVALAGRPRCRCRRSRRRRRAGRPPAARARGRPAGSARRPARCRSACASPAQQVGERDDRDRPAVLAGGGDGRGEQVGPGQRPRPVVDGDHVDLAGLDVGGQGPQRVRTPRRAGWRRRRRRAPRGRRGTAPPPRPPPSRSPGRTTSSTRCTSGSASASRTDQASTGRHPAGAAPC